MSHSHLSLRHFIQQLETERSDRPRGVQLPKWLQSFIEEEAELFEPVQGTARAGYVCSRVDGGWTVQLFLGLTEVVGGADDGAIVPTEFRYDLEAARSSFDEVDDVCLCRTFDVREPTLDRKGDASAVIVGHVNGEPLTLKILHRPPADMGPGLLQYSDGRCELV